MKRFFIVLFISCFAFSACGDEDECGPLQPGYYKATMTLKKDGCSLNTSKITTILKLEEGSELLQCGSYEESSDEYSPGLQCYMSSKLSTTSTLENISGEFSISFVCTKGGTGHEMLGKIQCADVFDFYAERMLIQEEEPDGNNLDPIL